ncbi:hypothetical protein PINS_up001326 [Pythium insidiosum]|nr:hypothetical protein PINS_up001326 [Pythium insidiosum]
MTWRWRALVLPLLALSSAVLTALHVLDLVATSARPSGCEMTYSWPVYTRLTHEWRRELRAHHKYALYSVHMQERREQLTGQPVLFLPGHLGSYKQARSLARHLWDHDAERFDVFALDFEEEWTGLHGALVERQAEFLNDAIRAILKQYKKQQKQQRRDKNTRSKTTTPDSVIVVAHSMGGVVARLAQRLPNYKRRSMPHIVTLGSPLARPAFPFDASLQRVYATLASTPAPDAASTVVVSIAGGHKDTTVHSSLSSSSSTDDAASSERELSVLSSALPGVGLTIDHLCLLWCHQLLDRVAASLMAITDATTRQLERDPDARLQAAHATLLQLNASDATALDAELARNRDALRFGYHSDDEFGAYGLWLPRALVHVLRTRLLSLAWMMFVVVVHVLHLQLVFWQRRLDLDTSSSASSTASSSPLLALDDEDAVDASAAGLPSFLTLLHPFNHVPPPLVHAVAALQQFVDERSSRRVSVLKTVVLPLVVVALAVLAELSRRYAAVHAVAMELLALAVLYGYALGALFVLSYVLALLRAAVLRPVLRVARSIAHRAQLPRWLGIALVLALVQVLGHVRDFELLPMDVGARHLALLQLGAIVVVVLHVVELGVKTTPEMTLAQQRYRTTQFALLALSGLAWVGDVGYALDLVAYPPPTVSNALLGHVALRLALLALVRHWVSRTDREMLPLPPTAFFDCSGDASREENATSTQTITAENCPRCIFEDGGPGAIFIEYEHPRETKRLRGRNRELVVVGPTFRVVACDCVVRFQDRRASYCAFCTRSCRLCGGGSGNWEQAQRAKEFLEQSTTDRAMHGIVASSLELVALAMLTLWPSEHHVLHATAAIAVLMVVYHAALRHPVELERMRKAQRKREQQAKRKSTQQQKKKKSKRSSGTSGSSSASSSTTPAPGPALAPATANAPTPAAPTQEPLSTTTTSDSAKSKKKKTKAKKKAPNSDSTTTSAPSFMDAYAADMR